MQELDPRSCAWGAAAGLFLVMASCLICLRHSAGSTSAGTLIAALAQLEDELGVSWVLSCLSGCPGSQLTVISPAGLLFL